MEQFNGAVDLLNLRDGQVHLVCPALNGLTIFRVCASLVGGIPPQECEAICNKINTLKSVQTMFPTLALTAMPLHRTWQESHLGPAACFGNESQIRHNLEECLNIHTQSIKSPIIIFALDQGNVFDIKTTKRILNQLLEERIEFQRGGKYRVLYTISD
jgi:hypothetical protein